MTTFRLKLHTYLKQTWWVFAFVFLCAFFYEKGLMNQQKLHNNLKEQLKSLKAKKKEALHSQELLKQRLNKLNDSEFIDLTLRKELGLVPKGQIKVVFIDQNNQSEI